MSVKPITRKMTIPYIMGIHYAKRMPSVSWAFGLYDDEDLIGVCTYGTPSSAPLRSGVCGKTYADKVIELNRLCLKHNRKNEASFLVGRSLRLLPTPKIVISFADTDQKHMGIVYQACNFIYTGLSAKRTDWKIRGMEHLHGQTVADEFRGVEDRAGAMRAKYGDDFYLKPRSRKHRYLYFLGSHKFKKEAINNLKYRVEAYPTRESGVEK